jgi:hypothetical protein
VPRLLAGQADIAQHVVVELGQSVPRAANGDNA